MNNKAILFCAGATLLALLVAVPQAHADCCGYWYNYPETNFRSVARCADCSLLVGSYCGTGPCNLFGCNCNCRKPVAGRTCTRYCCDRSDRKSRAVDMPTAGNDTMDSLPAWAGSYTGHDVVGIVDQDKDGRLNGAELQLWFQLRGEPIAEHEWRALDQDQDGHLTAHEIDPSLHAPGLKVILE